MSFAEHLREVPIEALLERASRATPADVDQALDRTAPDLWDFASLLSPAATTRLEDLARRSHEITMRRFGKVVQLYAPLYVSNECVETCTYCSFSRANPIRRRTLTVDEVVEEARLLTDRGFRHLLLVSGEHPRNVAPEYLSAVIGALRESVPSLSVEVQPQTEAVYRDWVGAGADGLVVYQETYDRAAYAAVHLAGKKKDYDYRLETPDRGGRAGMRRLGIGALLGLADWRYESVHLAAHARYLMRRYWKAMVSVSFPRLRAAAFAIGPRTAVADRDLVQMVCAFRMLLPDAGIVLSTREHPAFRDGMLGLGITQMSAGSRTEPGGYSARGAAEEQFRISDDRSPEEVARSVRERGYDPVWKDWEVALHG